MPVEVAKEYIDDFINLSENDLLDISFFGGEPFLAFETIKEVCEYCWKQKTKKGFLFTAITNGCAFSEESKEWLRKNRDKISVVLSFDGTPQSQNINRGNSFSKVDINFFKENWPNSGVKMTVSDKSLNNLFEDIAYVHSLGLRIIECNLAFGIDWSNVKNKGVFKAQMLKLVEFYSNNKEIEPALIINSDVIACENEKKLVKICGAYESRYIDTDGKIYPCNYINPECFEAEDLAYLMGVDYSKIEELEDIECFNNCYIYPICPTCYASNYSINGKINIRDKSLCEINKMRAYYSSLLWSIRNLSNDIDELSFDEKALMHRRIAAVKKVLSEYHNLIEDIEVE